jgi:hypothetical protein
MSTQSMGLTELNDTWRPPDFCLTWLIVTVTLVAAVSLVLSTLLLVPYVREAEVPPPELGALWFLYAAVAATGVKALTDWMSERKAVAS